MAKLEPFGQVAIRLGFCTQEDVDKALEMQRNLPSQGKEHRLIGLLLLELGALSTTQLIEILQYYEHSARVPQLEDEAAPG
jgi:hypothetical protein